MKLSGPLGALAWFVGAGVLAYLVLVQLAIIGVYRTPYLAGAGVNTIAAVASLFAGTLLLRGSPRLTVLVAAAGFAGSVIALDVAFGGRDEGVLPYAIGSIALAAIFNGLSLARTGVPRFGRRSVVTPSEVVSLHQDTVLGAPAIGEDGTSRRGAGASVHHPRSLRWAQARPIALALVVAAVIVGATFLRQTGTPKSHTVWGEDGPIFVWCAYELPLTDCLAVPFEGYLLSTPRLAAALVTMADPHDLPFALTLVSALVAAACGVLVARAVAQAVRSSVAGLLSGTSLALVLAARIEVSGNLTNLHAIMFVASAVVLACSWLGRRVGRLDLTLIALTAVTSPFGPLVAAGAVPGVIARTVGSRRTLAVASVASVPQVMTLLTTARTPTGGQPLALSEFLKGSVDAITYWVCDLPVGAFIPLIGIGFLAAMIALHLRQDGLRWPRRPSGPSLIATAAAALALVTLGEGALIVSAVQNHQLSVRYFYAPAALTVCALALCAGALQLWWLTAHWPDESSVRRRAGVSARLLPSLLAVILGVGFASSFFGPAYASSGPDATAGIAATASRCTSPTGQIQVPISAVIPTGWYVFIPCSRLIHR